MPEDECPRDEALYEFLDSELPPEEAVAVLRHLSSCPSCMGRIREMRRTLDYIEHGLAKALDVSGQVEFEIIAREQEVRDELEREGLITGHPGLAIRAGLTRAAGRGARVACKGAAVAARAVVGGIRLAARAAGAVSSRRGSAQTIGAPLGQALRVIAKSSGGLAKSLIGPGLARLGMAL